MTEVTFGVKTLISAGSIIASVVTAYWLARRSASQETLSLERKLSVIRLQLTELSMSSQDRDDVKELVKESLDSLSVILKAIQNTSDSNSEDLKSVLIQQSILNEKVRTLEQHTQSRK